MKNIFLIAHAVILFVTSSYSVSSAHDFELVKQSNHISLYERWIPSKSGEQVRELKAVLLIKSDVRTVVKLLRDSDRGSDWNTHANAYRILPAKEPNNWITYIRYGMPWPFNDQDCCLHYQMLNQPSGSTWVKFSSVRDSRFPINSTIDRIRGVRGEWLLEKLDEAKTKVTYMITTDKSKKIPRWISDPVIHNNLFSTMNAFKAMAEHDYLR